MKQQLFALIVVVVVGSAVLGQTIETLSPKAFCNLLIRMLNDPADSVDSVPRVLARGQELKALYPGTIGSSLDTAAQGVCLWVKQYASQRTGPASNAGEMRRQELLKFVRDIKDCL